MIKVFESHLEMELEKLIEYYSMISNCLYEKILDKMNKFEMKYTIPNPNLKFQEMEVWINFPKGT